jgi:hypothetical protein
MALKDDDFASSTAEGGAGAADSAQVIYTGTAVSAKAKRVIGYLEWSSGLATAGTWSAVPTKIQLFGPGVPMPGQIIQRQRVTDSSAASTSVVIPFDDTVPQNTEGAQNMSLAITPTSAANLLDVEHTGVYGANAAGELAQVALFRDATAGALHAIFGAQSQSVNGISGPVSLKYCVIAGSISATTFKTRYGPSGGSNTLTFNGAASAGKYGGVSVSALQISELMT